MATARWATAPWEVVTVGPGNSRVGASTVVGVLGETTEAFTVGSPAGAAGVASGSLVLMGGDVSTAGVVTPSGVGLAL